MIEIIKRTVENFTNRIEIREEVYEAYSIEEVEKLRESILPYTGDWYAMQVSCYVRIDDQIYVARGKHWCPAVVSGDFSLILTDGIDLDDRGVFGG